MSKIGFHCNQSPFRDEIDKIIRAEPKVVKVITNVGMMNAIHDALGNKTMILCRQWDVGDTYQRFYRAGESADAAAKRWYDEMKDKIVQTPYAFFEAFNEMSDWQLQRSYGEFEAARVRLMADKGYKCCIGNFSAGTPPAKSDPNSAWEDFYPALEALHQHGGVLGLHEYASVFLWLWYGSNNLTAWRAGTFQHYPRSYEEGWLLFRYRRFWREHVAPHGWTNIRIVINETGIDRAGNVDGDQIVGYSTSGWRTCGEAWSRLVGRPDTPQFYLDQWKWADFQLKQDSYVVGNTIFNWGGAWENWEIEPDAANLLIDYIIADRNEVPPSPVYGYATPNQSGIALKDVNGNILEVLKRGDLLEVLTPDSYNLLDTLGIRVNVRSPRGLVGYVLSDFLSPALIS